MARRKKGHRQQSGRLSKQHTTCIPEAGWLVDAGLKLPRVGRMSLGVIVQTKHAPPRLKFTPVNGGFKVQVRGRNAVQIVMVYTDDPVGTQSSLQAAFNEKVG